MNKTLYLLLFFTGISLSLFAQKATTYTISGNIKDAATGEDLIGAAVQIKELKNTGSITNVYGFYSISLPTGNYTIIYSFMGYSSQEIKIKLDKNIQKTIELSTTATQLGAVEITGKREDGNVRDNEMSVTKVDLKEADKIPVIFGEKDVMKTLQLMPGVKSEGDGGAGFFVRGGSADQNLILLDEAPVYNASHMMGFFSVFNSDALKDVKLYKGGAPAQYGGRLSSVLDIKMKEGNMKEMKVSGGIGVIASKLTIEAPIVKDKGSFIISGRRTYADLFLKLSSDESKKNTTLYFYDLNLKANYILGKKDRIYISGYLGRDQFGFNDEFGFDWGNKTLTARWNHIFGEKLFSNTSFIISDYNYVFKAKFGSQTFEAGSDIMDINLKNDYQYYANNKNTVSFGWNIIHHTFRPGELKVDNVIIPDNTLEKRYSLESALYIANEQKIGDQFILKYGLRFSNFTKIGPGNIYTFDIDGNVTDIKEYKNWEPVASYNGLAPRFSSTFIINEVSSVKASYARTYQYLHLLSNSTSSTPTDVWLPSSNNIKPEIADQVALGYFRNFKRNQYEFSAEIYYKDIQNAIDYRTGAEVQFNPMVEGDLLYGVGRAYGLELLFKKRKGRFTGWISYTLARTEKSFEDIDGGKYFPTRQDRTHDIALIGMYDITEQLSVAATWVYYTGNAVTFPSGKYVIDGHIINLYTERNGYRMPDYHRLDIGVTYKLKDYKYKINKLSGAKERVKRKIYSSWNFSVYNAYGRENAYSISFQQNENDPTKMEAVQIALFKFVPSITWNFNF
jgi:outer membrane receptor for ferrienterochelin and colicin